MSAHLLPVSAEWLARLPNGVALSDPDRGHLGRTVVGYVGYVYAVGAGRPWTVTAAVVAARIVRPWLAATLRRDALDIASSISEWEVAREIVTRAMQLDPLTAAQIETLARLARAAMEAG